MTISAGSRIAQRLHRGEHARPGRQSVVDQDHRLAGDVERWPTVAVGGLTADQLAALALGDLLQLLRGDAQAAQHVVVDHDTATAGQRAHRELFVAGCTELADDERVQGSPQCGGHLPCDRNAAARQTQDDDVRLAAVRLQQAGQHLTRLAAVFEDPSRLLTAHGLWSWRAPFWRLHRSAYLHPITAARVRGRGRSPRRIAARDIGDTGDMWRRLAGSAIASAGLYAARQYYRNWGTTKDECETPLPGDELVEAAGGADHRGRLDRGPGRATCGRGWCRWARTAAGCTATRSWRTWSA